MEPTSVLVPRRADVLPGMGIVCCARYMKISCSWLRRGFRYRAQAPSRRIVCLAEGRGRILIGGGWMCGLCAPDLGVVRPIAGLKSPPRHRHPLCSSSTLLVVIMLHPRLWHRFPHRRPGSPLMTLGRSNIPHSVWTACPPRAHRLALPHPPTRYNRRRVPRGARRSQPPRLVTDGPAMPLGARRLMVGKPSEDWGAEARPDVQRSQHGWQQLGGDCGLWLAAPRARSRFPSHSCECRRTAMSCPTAMATRSSPAAAELTRGGHSGSS